LLLSLESLSAIDLAEKQLNTKPSVPTAEEALRQAMMASEGTVFAATRITLGHIDALAISPNGRWLVTGGGKNREFGKDDRDDKYGVVCKWDLSTDDGVYSPNVLSVMKVKVVTKYGLIHWPSVQIASG